MKGVLSPAFTNQVPFLGSQCYTWRRIHRRCIWPLNTRDGRKQPQFPLRRTRRARVIAAVEKNESADLEAPASDLEPSVSSDFIDALLLEAEREERVAAAVGDVANAKKSVQTFPETTNGNLDSGPSLTEQTGGAGGITDEVNFDDISAFFDDNVVVDDDELVSDDTHVVIDGSDVMNILGRLKSSYPGTTVKSAEPQSNQVQKSHSSPADGGPVEGKTGATSAKSSSGDNEDAMTTATPGVFDPDGSFEAALQRAAEELSDARYAQRSTELASNKPAVPLSESEGEDAGNENSVGTMDYFTEENAMYMPSWIREMYEADAHHELQRGADRLVPSGSVKRLQDIVERRRGSKTLDAEVKHDDGIIDCTVGDVAYDYHVPVEFIVDALLAIGVPVPVTESTSIRDSMTSEEISRLLRLVSTHDPAVLADRYSDNCIDEIADDYNIRAEDIISICKREGLYLCNGTRTHLSVVREDRVLDILLKGEALGKPYPPLLQGLE